MPPTLSINPNSAISSGETSVTFRVDGDESWTYSTNLIVVRISSNSLKKPPGNQRPTATVLLLQLTVAESGVLFEDTSMHCSGHHDRCTSTVKQSTWNDAECSCAPTFPHVANHELYLRRPKVNTGLVCGMQRLSSWPNFDVLADRDYACVRLLALAMARCSGVRGATGLRGVQVRGTQLGRPGLNPLCFHYLTRTH